MATDAERIVIALDALIRAKIEGVADVSALFDKSLGSIGVSAASSLSTLTDMRDRWDKISRTQSFTEIHTQSI